MKGAGLEEFRKAHDPTYETLRQSEVFSRALSAGTKRYIVTAAQNATPLEPGFLAVLERIATLRGAEILIIPLRYKNPTSRWTGSQQNAEWWAPETRPHLWSKRHQLHKNLTLLADIKLQPTRQQPLTGLEVISKDTSAIVGHVRINTKSVASPHSRMAKLLMTSGACTMENYTDSGIGPIAEFHHSISAVLVETDGPRFFMRRLHWDRKTKSITDLGQRYTAKGAATAPRALALAQGDTHVDYADPSVIKGTFGDGGLVELTRPEHIVWHDLLDGYSCNPHHEGKAFTRLSKRFSGRDSVAAEVKRAVEFVPAHTPKGSQSIVIPSNHNDFLRRWIDKTDWREDPTNAEFYLQTALYMARHTVAGPGGSETPDPFRYWFERAKYAHCRMLADGEAFVLAKVDLGQHGDKGPNGARGSIKNIRRIGLRSIIGHSHSPGEDEGCMQVGTSTLLKLEYNGGPSSWLNAHAVLNADGHRQLVVFVDGVYCA